MVGGAAGYRGRGPPAAAWCDVAERCLLWQPPVRACCGSRTVPARPARPVTCATRGIRVAHGLPARARLGPRLGPRAHFAHSVTDFRGDLTGNVDAGGVQSERVMLMGHKEPGGGRQDGRRAGRHSATPAAEATNRNAHRIAKSCIAKSCIAKSCIAKCCCCTYAARSTFYAGSSAGKTRGASSRPQNPTHRSRPDVQSARRVKITASRSPRQDRRTTTAAPTPSASA
jgi:hypothetical protein